ncbi:DgyrCDS4445 [Dimorphilus gyrociliatus]|uniref:non-specific protein-tyrosine kinase n=1 Tax=Dimorphilus gyrociliatus TaxID=2664684 RepID=A0A7I8VGP4_9ANNE|nr:DgyrCDS4445 [Dimorphilus gyrociliatus]
MTSPDISKDLYTFLSHLGLVRYYGSFETQDVHDLKRITDEELLNMGMTQVDIKKLRKFYRQEFSKIGKVKRIMKTRSNASDIKSPPLPRASVTQHLIPYSSLTLGGRLGSGSTGWVQEGVWSIEGGGKIPVALKTLRGKVSPEDAMKEVAFMHQIDHKRIIKMYGVVLNSPDGVMTVSELATMGSLNSCLVNKELRFTFHLLRLCDIAVQICDAMVYLENKQIVHKNLNTHNIVVFSPDKIKVCDFGSRALGHKEISKEDTDVSLRLPIGWQAPECLRSMKFTSASDVWAFGVTLWEMFSYGDQPWPGFTRQQVIDELDGGKRLPCSELCTKEYYALILQCWEEDTFKRSTFSNLFQWLPQLKPEQVQAISDFSNTIVPKGYLPYRKRDIITVIEKRPNIGAEEGLWRGVSNSGVCGLFNHKETIPIDSITREASGRTNVAQRSSSFLSQVTKMGRKSNQDVKKNNDKKSARKPITKDMINSPTDMQHKAHVGYDGSKFGNVEDYDNNLLEEKNYGSDPPAQTVLETMPLEEAQRKHGIKLEPGEPDLTLDFGDSLFDDVMKTIDLLQSPSISTEKVNSDQSEEQQDTIYNEEEYNTIKIDSEREESEYELSTPSYTIEESISNTNLNFETTNDTDEISETPPDVSEIFDKFAPKPTDIIYETQPNKEKERDYENCRLADQAFSWNDGQERRRSEISRPPPSPVQSSNSVKNTAAHILARPIDIEKKDDIYETYTMNPISTNSNFNDSGYYGKNYKRISNHSDTTVSDQSSSPTSFTEKSTIPQPSLSTFKPTPVPTSKSAPSAEIEDLSEDELNSRPGSQVSPIESPKIEPKLPPFNPRIDEPDFVSNRMEKWRRDRERKRFESFETNSEERKNEYKAPLADFYKPEVPSTRSNLRNPIIPGHGLAKLRSLSLQYSESQ